MPEYKGIKFDSQEELDFVYFLEDLNIPYIYQPESLILAEPVKETITVKLKTKEKRKKQLFFKDVLTQQTLLLIVLILIIN